MFFTARRTLHATMLVALTFALAACGGPPQTTVTMTGPEPEVVARYAAVEDNGTLIPAVNPGYLIGQNARTRVAYAGSERPGTVVVDPHARVLYYVDEGGTAMRYGIAVGREGRGFRGSAVISVKREWPRWTPTRNMIRTDPEVYGPYAAGLPGGIENPLGARALYLYRNGRDTYYRIHGTNNPSTIGRATSAGCIRLFNQDILDLYERVEPGSPVKVRTLEESLAMEGEMVENEHGLMVPLSSYPPEVQAEIRAGNIPWPKFTAMLGVAADEDTDAGGV
ncbi:L,D-transpeptidase [Ostreiculturibacter nitratireducens]|uniref:L,D-transpeptidase n=1 Tax=Ostreiculturibacter nitratireducens TaxID=3075226 RepID=UPI0031B5ABCC